MEGTIISRTDHSCIIRTDKGEEYYGPLDRVRDPEGFREGAKVSFEPSKYDPPAGKKRGAIRLRLLETSKSEFVPQPKRNPDDLLIKISFAFADPVLQVIVKTNRIGENVKLKAGSQPMYPEEGIDTEADGQAEFVFEVTDPNCGFLFFEVVIGEKRFSKTWFRNPPQPAAETAKQQAEKASPVHLKVQANQVPQVMVFDVIATKGSKPDSPMTETKFTVRSESGTNQFRICEAGSNDWQTGSEVELYCPGRKTYQFQWKTRIPGEHVYFRADGNPQDAGRHYVTGHCLAPPESGPSTSPATTIH